MGIGSAPEFLDRLMWKKFSKKIKKEIIIKKIYQLKHGEYKYPITYQIIKDGKKNKVLKKKYKIEIPVTMVHGSRDEVVPVSFLLEAKELFNRINYKIQTKIFQNCEHRIPQEGSSLGLEFIKKKLY